MSAPPMMIKPAVELPTVSSIESTPTSESLSVASSRIEWFPVLGR